MEIQFILDTNAYRRIAEALSIRELQPTANEMRKREAKKNARSLMSEVVGMELLRHFDDTDPDFQDCFKALCLQYHHTQSNFNGRNNHIDFIPPLNVLLTKHYFDHPSPVIKQYIRIIEIIENATKDLNINAYKNDLKDIGIISDQLLHEKVEIKNNFEEFIKSYNHGHPDWSYFVKDRKIKPLINKDIRSGKFLTTLGKAMLVRAHNILGLRPFEDGLDAKFDDFLSYYHPVLKLNQMLFSKMLDGAVTMADPRNVKWNTLNDMQITAALCYATYREKDNNVRVILVTNDKGIHKGCQGTYVANNVWNLQQYKSFIY